MENNRLECEDNEERLERIRMCLSLPFLLLCWKIQNPKTRPDRILNALDSPSSSHRGAPINNTVSVQPSLESISSPQTAECSATHVPRENPLVHIV